ncbi:MAG: polysaccharide deacetylase family protein [Caulobacteraceae bacterium]|nr:polysaccharide deacetylase family protein [Caulobacteraceae bacterium]
MRTRSRLSLLLGLGLALLSAPARAEPVALTFDDLPALSFSPSTDYWEASTKSLLAGLVRRRIPATGFVTESKLEGPDAARRVRLLIDWLDAGMDLGNHGYSHESLNKTPLDDYIADTARGELVTRGLLADRGRRPRWFRYPYLETGTAPEVRARFEGWLAAHGYRVAPVTMENSDWLFAVPYDDAVMRGDAAAAARIKRSYLDYTAAVTPWYRQAALQLLGRRPAFVFLLHATRLNADSLNGLVAILKANHLHPVSLDRAMADPAYRIPDTYVGPDGDEWLSRWAMTLGKELPWASFPSPPDDIAAEDRQLEGDSQ